MSKIIIFSLLTKLLVANNTIIMDKDYYYDYIGECTIPIKREFIGIIKVENAEQIINGSKTINDPSKGLILIFSKNNKKAQSILNINSKYYKFIKKGNKYGYKYFLYRDLLFKKFDKSLIGSGNLMIIYFKKNIFYSIKYDFRELDHILDTCYKTKRKGSIIKSTKVNSKDG